MLAEQTSLQPASHYRALIARLRAGESIHSLPAEHRYAKLVCPLDRAGRRCTANGCAEVHASQHSKHASGLYLLTRYCLINVYGACLSLAAAGPAEALCAASVAQRGCQRLCQSASPAGSLDSKATGGAAAANASGVARGVLRCAHAGCRNGVQGSQGPAPACALAMA